MNVILKGSIKLIFEQVFVNDNLSKKEVVITIDEDTQYPQDIKVQALNSKADLFNELKNGEKVSVTCYLKGSLSNGKYFFQFNVLSVQKN